MILFQHNIIYLKKWITEKKNLFIIVTFLMFGLIFQLLDKVFFSVRRTFFFLDKVKLWKKFSISMKQKKKL
jgi:hypothetical protein